MKIEILYFDGCPSWQPAVANLEAALTQEGLQAPIQLVRVVDDEQAEALQFVGSPSIRVDGADLWPVTGNTYSLACRVYVTPAGLRGWPSTEMILSKLREALA